MIKTRVCGKRRGAAVGSVGAARGGDRGAALILIKGKSFVVLPGVFNQMKLLIFYLEATI